SSDVICYVYGKGLRKHQLTPTQRLNQKQVSRISNINRTIERIKNQWQKKNYGKNHHGKATSSPVHPHQSYTSYRGPRSRRVRLPEATGHVGDHILATARGTANRDHGDANR